MARRWLIAGLCLVLGVGLLACSKEVAANDLEVGECVEDESTLNSADIDSVDCGDEHLFELIGRFDVEDQDDYPGTEALEAESIETCQGDLFEDYVGQPFDPTGEVLVTQLYPSEDTWEQAADRTVLCFGFPSDLAPTTGSFAG